MNKIPSSFRDPSGFIFKQKDQLFRQINPIAKKDYENLMTSGLYKALTDRGLLVPHEEVENIHPEAYKTIVPEKISFISYPYEWSFAQLKDAALCTLRIQKIALKRGMTLKDASAYNIQFSKGKACLIDTLSFEIYEEGKPWVAYRQFCQHFLAPLALASYCDFRLNKLFASYIDGIPLDLASKLLPGRTKLNFALAAHIHWHAKNQRKHADKGKQGNRTARISKNGLLGLLNNLENAVKKMTWKPGETEWGDYYNNTNYSATAFEAKKVLIQKFLTKTNALSLWDMGANDGTFSALGAEMGMQTLAFDIDPIAVNKNYLRIKQNGEENMLPLLMDLTNPSNALGWAHAERDSLAQRGKAGCLMALALIHHLAISNNVPLVLIASYFAQLGDYLIIEFVPKQDSKVQTLLATREDIFPEYTLEYFEKEFSGYFELIEKRPVQDSERTLFLFKTK